MKRCSILDDPIFEVSRKLAKNHILFRKKFKPSLEELASEIADVIFSPPEHLYSYIHQDGTTPRLGQFVPELAAFFHSVGEEERLLNKQFIKTVLALRATPEDIAVLIETGHESITIFSTPEITRILVRQLQKYADELQILAKDKSNEYAREALELYRTCLGALSEEELPRERGVERGF